MELKIKEVQRRDIEKHCFRIENGDPATVVFDDDTGQLCLTICEESYSYYWGNIGKQSLKEFFCSCNNDYLLKKLMGRRNMSVFDFDATIKGLKESCIEARKEGNSKKATRQWWNEIKEIMKSDCESDFFMQFTETSFFTNYFCNDSAAVYIAEKPSQQCYWLDKYLTLLKEYFKNEAISTENKLWNWFGLSYASWLTLPRVLCHEMPKVWQNKLAKLLDQYYEAFPNQPEVGTRVQITENGKLIKTPEWLINYRHPHYEEIKKLKNNNSVTEKGAITMIDWKSYEVEFEDGHKASVEDTFPKYAAEQACADHHRAAGYPNEFNNVKVYCLDDGYKGTFDVSVNREPQFSAEEV